VVFYLGAFIRLPLSLFSEKPFFKPKLFSEKEFRSSRGAKFVQKTILIIQIFIARKLKIFRFVK
jgi:hypothetical protein